MSEHGRGSGSPPDGQDPATEGDVRAPLVRPWILVIGSLVGATAIGFLAGRSYWELRPVAPDESADIADDSFSGAAFSPQATAEDLLSEADRVVDELLEAYPNTVESLTVRARKQFMLGDFDAAQETWQQCLEIDPQFVTAIFGTGLIAVNQGNYAAAAEWFRRVLESRATDPRARVLYAESLLKSGSAAEAAAVLEAYISTEPSSVEAVATLGQAYLQLRHYEKARVTFEAAVKVAPDLSKAVYGLGRAYAYLGERQKAEEYLAKHRSLATAELQDNRAVSKAFVDDRFVRELVAQTHSDAAQVFAGHGETVKAAEMLRKAIHLFPPNVESLTELLALSEKTGRYEDAWSACRQLVHVEPGNARHWLNFAVLSARLNRAEEALAAAKKAVQLDPLNPSCRDAYERIKQTR